MSGRDHNRDGTGRTADLSRRTMLRVGSGVLGLTGLSGTIHAGLGSEGQPAAAETTWGRVVSIHPRWYWGGAGSVRGSRRAMRDWLDMAAVSGVNVLHAWIESPEAAAILGEPRYASAYEFWDPTRWDALGELITAAAERGIEVHLWYSFTRYKRNRDLVPEYDSNLAVLPPGDPGWASIRKKEYTRGLTDPSDPRIEGDALCNNEFEAHDWTMELFQRLFDRYPGLNGLKIEEPGYLASDRCVCPRCQSAYAARYDEPGENLLDHVYGRTAPYYEDDRAVPIKTRGTDEFARRLYDWWTESGPSDALFYTGSWLARWDRVRGRNWAVWSSRGLVPYFIPQTFASSVPVFDWKLRATLESLSYSSLVPSVGIVWGFGENDPDQVAAQIERANDVDGGSETPIEGTSLFSGGAMTLELARTLRTGPYATEAVPPWYEGSDGMQRGTALAESELDQLDPFSWRGSTPEGLPGGALVRPAQETTGLAGGELGRVTHYQNAFDDWQTVPLLRRYSEPVVITKPLSYEGTHPCHPRVGNVSQASFDFKLEEWSYLDVVHTTETAHYLVVESGVTGIDGLPAERGHLQATHEPRRLGFDRDFSIQPVVFTQPQTVRGPEPVVARNEAVSVDGMTVRLQEEEGEDSGGWHRDERVGYLAVEPGSGTAFGRKAEVGRTQTVVDDSWHRIRFANAYQDPWIVADLQTFYGSDPAALRYRNLTGSGVDVFVEEEQSQTARTVHGDESVGYLVVEGS